MKLAIALVVVAGGTAFADHCDDGLAAAKAGELAKAALKLDGCTSDDAVAAAHTVQQKLEASQLSALVISGDGIAFTTTAMPGENLVAPATVWAKAGTYTITVGAQQLSTTVGAHSRSSILLEKPRGTPPPKDRTVDIGSDEPAEPPVQGPPPAQKFKSILPCEYEGCNTAAGDLADPLATGPERFHEHPPALRIGARLGVTSTESIGMSGAVTAHGQWLALRADVAQHEVDHMAFTDFGFAAGVAHPVWSPRAAWIGLGLALRGDLGTHDHQNVGASGEIELALRALPVTVAARYDQMFDGDHAIVVEIGADWRLFRN
ncbi:MAG: hypothetical protein QM831_15165 [Kofleriaceae bacterium]